MSYSIDSDPILPNGTGTPYLAIFDGDGAPIIDEKLGLPIGMLLDNFIYEYTEEKEDSGSFVITTDNSDLPSNPKLAYQMPLKLQWGWIYPDGSYISGPIRKVIVIGSSSSFTSNGVTLEIKFADASILLKQSPAVYFSRDAEFYQDLIKICEGQTIGVEMLDYTTIPATEKVILRRTGTTT